ncbi:hypothetical protein XNC3_2390025 [Xenorhabdus nematophila F1]|nr:hypothetical protein XNC3_2390025 [Xenorhabdus nematophila F1]CEK22639.1 protein of unknown function [Xenorhabdus nematophila AN6/1]
MGMFGPPVGSKNVANESPICKPRISPAWRTTAKAICMVSPKATPIRICCIKTQIPAMEKIGMWGEGMLGTNKAVITNAKPILTFIGICFSLKIGAMLNNANKRTKGQKKSLTRRESVSLSNGIIINR